MSWTIFESQKSFNLELNYIILEVFGNIECYIISHAIHVKLRPNYYYAIIITIVWSIHHQV